VPDINEVFLRFTNPALEINNTLPAKHSTNLLRYLVEFVPGLLQTIDSNRRSFTPFLQQTRRIY
jgi:hypothetical protein